MRAKPGRVKANKYERRARAGLKFRGAAHVRCFNPPARKQRNIYWRPSWKAKYKCGVIFVREDARDLRVDGCMTSEQMQRVAAVQFFDPKQNYRKVRDLIYEESLGILPGTERFADGSSLGCYAKLAETAEDVADDPLWPRLNTVFKKPPVFRYKFKYVINHTTVTIKFDFEGHLGEATKHAKTLIKTDTEPYAWTMKRL